MRRLLSHTWGMAWQQATGTIRWSRKDILIPHMTVFCEYRCDAACFFSRRKFNFSFSLPYIKIWELTSFFYMLYDKLDVVVSPIFCCKLHVLNQRILWAGSIWSYHCSDCRGFCQGGTSCSWCGKKRSTMPGNCSPAPPWHYTWFVNVFVSL